MLGWMQVTEEEEKIYHKTGSLEDIENLIFIFAISDELKCGSKGKLKDNQSRPSLQSINPIILNTHLPIQARFDTNWIR